MTGKRSEAYASDTSLSSGEGADATLTLNYTNRNLNLQSTTYK